MPTRILVVGCGFLGQRLAERIGAGGAAVTGVVRNPDSNRSSSGNADWNLVAGDVADPASVKKLADDLPGTDLVIHCASSGRGGESAYRDVFLDGCGHLLAAFPQARLMFTSSTSVYGQTDGAWVDENSPAEPDRPTGRILREAEELVINKGGIVCRLAGLYGPGRSYVLKKLIEGTASIEGNDGHGRYLNQIHVDDCVSAIVWLAGHADPADPAVYNIVDNHPETQLECYSWLAPMFDRPLPSTAPPNPNRKRGWTHKRVANRRLRDLGWQPRYLSYRDAVLHDPDLVPSILHPPPGNS